MSKKSLNHANLEALGTAKLADLLMEVSLGHADIKRRLRLELSHNLGAGELARDVRKRLASLRKSKSYVGWRKRKSLIKDLETQAEMIVQKIAPEDATIAFELLWEFMELAPSILVRVDDSRGDVASVFRAALEEMGPIVARAQIAPLVLADQIWSAISDDAFGTWAGVIGACVSSMDVEAVERLRAHVRNYADATVEEGAQHEAIEFIRQLRGGVSYALDRKTRFVRACLQDIALARGDVDGFVAQYGQQDLQRKSIAVRCSEMLLGAGRASEALDLLEAAELSEAYLETQVAWRGAIIDTLEALGRDDDAQAHRFTSFQESLNAGHLRDYLRRLPDFDDVDAEEDAKQFVRSWDDLSDAMSFFMEWPDLWGLEVLVELRSEELHDVEADILQAAADAARSRHARAAVLCMRVLIERALFEGQTSNYGQALDWFADCSALDLEIDDYDRFPTNSDFEQRMRGDYGMRRSFWAKLDP